MTEDFDPADLEDSPRDAASLEELEKIEQGERLASVYLQDAATLLASAKLEPDWLVPNAVPLGAVSFFVGRPGAAKSWLAYDLACAVVQQRDWLGFGVPNCPPGATVFILNFDNPHAELGRRFLRLGLQPHDALFAHSFGAHTPPEPYPPVLQLPDAFDPLEMMVYAKRPALIVIDSLRQAHTGDESSSQEMAVVMMCVKRFAALGAAVVLIHHTRKNDGQMRGSTEIEATADAITDVEKEDALVSLVSWRKTRGWEMAESSLAVRVVDEGDRTFVRGGIGVVEALREGALNQTDLATKLGLPEKVMKKVVDDAINKGLIALVKRHDGARLLEVVKRG